MSVSRPPQWSQWCGKPVDNQDESVHPSREGGLRDRIAHANGDRRDDVEGSGVRSETVTGHLADQLRTEAVIASMSESAETAQKIVFRIITGGSAGFRTMI